MPKSLTVSQLLGEGSSHWETRSHRPCTSHWGARTGRKGPRARAAWRGTLGLSKGDGGEAGGRSLLGTGQGQVQWGSMGRGHSGENSISGKTGIHFKMSAQKGQQGCSQARQGPQFPQFFPRGLQPHGGPWPESAGRHHIRYEARAGGAMSSPFSEQSGVWGARGRASGHLSVDSPAHPPQPAPGTSFTSMLALPRYRAEGGEGDQG